MSLGHFFHCNSNNKNLELPFPSFFFYICNCWDQGLLPQPEKAYNFVWSLWAQEGELASWLAFILDSVAKVAYQHWILELQRELSGKLKPGPLTPEKLTLGCMFCTSYLDLASSQAHTRILPEQSGEARKEPDS